MTDLVPVAPALGRVTIRELLHRVVPATPIVQDRLGADNDQVLLVEQVVSLGAEPLFHAVGYSPADTADHVSATIRAVDRHPRGLDMAELFRSCSACLSGASRWESARCARTCAPRGCSRSRPVPPSWCGSSCSTTWPAAALVQLHPVPAGPGQARGTAPGHPRPGPGWEGLTWCRCPSGAINTLRASRGQVTRRAEHGSCRATDVAVSRHRPRTSRKWVTHGRYSSRPGRAGRADCTPRRRRPERQLRHARRRRGCCQGRVVHGGPRRMCRARGRVRLGKVERLPRDRRLPVRRQRPHVLRPDDAAAGWPWTEACAGRSSRGSRPASR